MKKLAVGLMVVIMAIVASVSCSMTAKVEAQVVYSDETTVVILVTEADGGARLVNAMKKLKEQGDMDYTISAGFVNSINGVENASDYSSFWALYTSDGEYAYPEWGTYEYGGETFGSASLGAESLRVKEGEYYIWHLSAYAG